MRSHSRNNGRGPQRRDLLSSTQLFIPEADEQNAETETKPTIIAKPKQATNHNNAMNQSIRVDIEKLDSFMNLVSELVIYRTRLEEINEDLQRSELREPLEQVSRIATDLQELVLKNPHAAPQRCHESVRQNDP